MRGANHAALVNLKSHGSIGSPTAGWGLCACVLMEMEMEVVGNGAKKKEGTVCMILIVDFGVAPVYSFSFYLQSRLEEMEDVDDAKDKLKLR